VVKKTEKKVKKSHHKKEKKHHKKGGSDEDEDMDSVFALDEVDEESDKFDKINEMNGGKKEKKHHKKGGSDEVMDFLKSLDEESNKIDEMNGGKKEKKVKKGKKEKKEKKEKKKSHSSKSKSHKGGRTKTSKDCKGTFRHYKIVEVDGKSMTFGRIQGCDLIPSTAAVRAFKSACHKLEKKNEKCKVTFFIKETTNGSKKKIFGPYEGMRVKLSKPKMIEKVGKDGKKVKYEVHYKPVVKYIGKSEEEK